MGIERLRHSKRARQRWTRCRECSRPYSPLGLLTNSDGSGGDGRSDRDCHARFCGSPWGRFRLAALPANQSLDDAHYLPLAWPPTSAVRTKRTLRSAPVVLVRGVRMPAYTKTGASIV